MEKQYETPETNVEMADLKLLRFKALSEMSKGGSLDEWVLSIKDVNEILCVAGMPVIMPEELNKKEVEVII
jgi:hypothetical protein